MMDFDTWWRLGRSAGFKVEILGDDWEWGKPTTRMLFTAIKVLLDGGGELDHRWLFSHETLFALSEKMHRDTSMAMMAHPGWPNPVVSRDDALPGTLIGIPVEVREDMATGVVLLVPTGEWLADSTLTRPEITVAILGVDAGSHD